MKKLNIRSLTSALVVVIAVVAVGLLVTGKGGIIEKNFDTGEAMEYTVYDSVDMSVFVVRDESLLYNHAGGNVVSLLDNGSKVNADSEVAVVFSDGAGAQNYAYLEYLESKLTGYDKINSQLALDDVDIDKLADEIEEDFNSIVDCVYDEDYSSISRKKLDYLVDISRRQIITGSTIDCSGEIEKITKQINETKSSCVPVSKITAHSSGFFSDTADGYESTLSFADISNVTAGQIKKALNSKPDEVQDSCIGKIMSGFTWYMVGVAQGEKVNTLEEGDHVKVLLNNSQSQIVTATVNTIRKDEGSTVIVLSSNDVNENTLSLRKVDAKVVLREYTGIKVPRSAVRVVDGNQCVYARVGNVTKLRYLNVIYSCDDYVLAAEPDDLSTVSYSGTHVKKHDRIILNARGLNNE